MEKRVSVPVQHLRGVLTAMVSVNGVPVPMIVDTGAERSVIAVATADRLGLRRDEWVSTDIQGTGGRDRRRLGRPDTLRLGVLALWRRSIVADNSLVVGPLPDGVDGLLGEDYLSPFDVELDPAAGTMTLYNVTGCSGRFVPWTGPYAATALWRPVRNVLAIAIKIGGRPLWAELDTGAQQSTVTLPGMVELGLQPGGSDSLRGFGKAALPTRLERFGSVQIGDAPAAPMQMLIAAFNTFRSIGALLGADYLTTRHVWISWATDQLFVAQ